ncbi:acyl-CoA dehydrogenase [Bradyrhizobium sp. JYMT SZCCT0180]|nr:acyl-CoA dehydrogenase [Bradyrhizobium sp. JYMT SZCCT0180]
MDFTLTPEQRALQSGARQFAREVLSGVRAATDMLPTAEQRFLATRPAYEAMVAAGYLRKCIPAPAGGDGNGLVDMAIMAEEFYSVNASVTLTMLGTVLGLLPVLIGGTPEQCGRFLGPFLQKRGAPLAGFCSSEPGGSANAGSPPPGEGVRTTARADGEEWVINGRKKWVSSATGWDRKGADLLCVVCRTGSSGSPGKDISVIAVERPERGIVFERAIESMGHRAHLVTEFAFEELRVPRSHVLGEQGAGLALSEASFTGTAALVGIFGVALMRAAFDFALHFARTERRGGIHPIIEHQAVGYALADAKTAIEAARYLSWRACHALDRQSPAAAELSVQAKVFGSETAVRVITDLMRVVGIDSYDRALPLASLLQDALALPIFDGGNMGIRRRQLHNMIMQPGYDPLSASGAAEGHP